MKTDLRRWLVPALVAVAVVPLGGMLVGCGSDDTGASGAKTTAETGNGSIVADAQSAVDVAKAPVDAWYGPETSPKPATNKKVTVVICTSQGLGCVRAADGVKEAGAALGWDTTVIDGKGDPATFNQAIRTAITTHADAIVLSAVPPLLIGDALQKAQEAHIPIVSIWNPKTPKEPAVSAYVGFDHVKQGELMADWVIADSGGKGKAILLTLDAFPELKERSDGFRKRLAECGGCKIAEEVKISVATFATALPGAVASALQRNPDADYVISPADTVATFAASGVRQAGKADSVKVAGYDAAPSNLEAIRNGDVEAMNIAEPAEWMGWQAVDELGRVFAGDPPDETDVRYRLFTADNVPDTKVWEGDYDFRAKYRQLWGLGPS